MTNDRLRDALLRNGLTPASAADRLKVDAKTVERWITTGRAPYPKHRHALAALLRESESYLWPSAISTDKATAVAESEVVKVYPHRSAIPAELWQRLLDDANRNIEVLVYVGMFLTEIPNLIKTMQSKARAGAQIRLLFGNPSSREVGQRGQDEGIGKSAVPAKVRNSLAYFRPLEKVDGVTIRCHGTILYNSIFRYDDEMIVNPHVYGFGAPHAPAMHLRRLSAGDLFDTYAQSFDRVWTGATAPKW